MNEIQKIPTETVAEKIKTNLRTIFQKDGEYYAMLFLLNRLTGLSGCVGLEKLLQWYVEKLEQAKDVKSNGLQVSDFAINGYWFAKAAQKAERYFRIVSGVEQLEDNDEPFKASLVKIGLSDSFRKYIDSIPEEEKIILKSHLSFQYADVVRQAALKELNNGLKNRPMIEKQSIFGQYDAPYTSSFSSIEERAEWESEHDIIVNEMHEEKGRFVKEKKEIPNPKSLDTLWVR